METIDDLVFRYRSFEALSRDELYGMLHLRSEVFVLEQDCPYLDLDFKDQKAMHLLGFLGENLVAYARIFAPGRYFQNTSIGRVVVQKKHREKKFGKMLMREAIRLCKQAHGLPIEISAQCYLERFYTELGFYAKGETYLEDNIPHRRMLL